MRKIQNAERACFSGKCDQGEQKVTPDVVSTKQPKLVWLLLLVIPKGTSQFFAKFFVVNGFFKIHLFCYFLLRTWLAVRHYTILPSFYGWHSIQKWFMHFKEVYFELSKQEQHISSRSSLHFVSKRSKQYLCAWLKQKTWRSLGKN